MQHIGEVLNGILPFKLDNIREMTEVDRAILRIQVNNWLKARNVHPAVKAVTQAEMENRG